jgi:phage tail sheath protein FI
LERVITSAVNDASTEANLLNEKGIVTTFNSFGSGLRTWGNRSAAFPSSTAPSNFISVQRTADILHESVELAMLQFIDLPISNALIDSIRDSVNSFINVLIQRGAIIDGSCTYDPSKNPSTVTGAGQLIFDVTFMPPTPAERITFESFIDINLLASLGTND